MGVQELQNRKIWIIDKERHRERILRDSGSQSFACRISPRDRSRGDPDLIDFGRAQPFLRLALYSPRLAYARSTSSTWYCLRSYCFHNTRNPVPPWLSHIVGGGVWGVPAIPPSLTPQGVYRTAARDPARLRLALLRRCHSEWSAAESNCKAATNTVSRNLGAKVRLRSG